MAGRAEYALAFETSGAVGSVALGRGDHVLESRTFSAPLQHAREFLPVIEALCRTYDVSPAHIGAIYVSIGPGSFTGLRIAVTVARTLALAIRRDHQRPPHLTGVPTLEVIAQNALQMAEPTPQVAVMLDAKRRRVYAGRFVLRADRYVPLDEPIEIDPARFLKDCAPDAAVLGVGVNVYRSIVDASGLSVLPEGLFTPHAEVVYRLGVHRVQRGLLVEPRELVPAYVRPPEAEERWNRRRAEESSGA